MNLRAFVLGVLIILFVPSFLCGQNYSAGINTENPSEYAVLHLVSPNGNQGLLIPNLSTSQRTSMTSLLSNAENGLMVYDGDLNAFYYWHNGTWNSVSQDGDSDPTNENQTVSAGTGINVTSSGQDFQISNVLPDQVITLTDGGNGRLSISGTYPNFTLDVPSLDDADSDISNEIQTLTKTGNTITLSNGGGSFDFSSGTPTVGQMLEWDGSNWVPVTPPGAQSLTFSGTTLDISNGNSIDLSPLVDDVDADPANELQTLSKSSNLVTLSNGGGSFTDEVDDADNDPVNEIELPATATLNQVLIWNGSSWVAGTDAVDDADNVIGNEYQDLSLAGNTLSLTNDGTTVDLSGYLDNTDAQNLSFDGSNLNISGGTGIDVTGWDTDSSDDFTNADETDPTVPATIKDGIDWTEVGSIPAGFADDIDNVDDADNVVGNEYQDLSLVGNTLSLTNDGTTVDLSGYLDNTDSQNLSFDGSNLNISGGTGIDVTGWDTDSSDDFTNADETDPTVPATIKDGIDWTEVGSIPAGFADDIDNVDDADNVIGNEYQDLSLAANILSLTNDGTTVDLSGYLDNTDNQTVDQFDLTGAMLNLSLLNDGAAPYTVDLSTFSIASVAGEAGNYLTNDGTSTSWVPLGTLAQLNTITSTEITNGSVSEADLANSIAGNGLAGGAGTPLSVDLTANSGMNFLSTQLQMEELYPGGITYDDGAATAIRSITFDSKGRFVGATSIAVLLSDIRLKKEITHLNNSLEKVIQLNGYNYYLKSDSLNKELKTGVMAQEVEEFFPNLVIKRPDGFLGVDYQGLIPILVEAIKEQQVVIENLEKDLGQQETVNQNLESRVTAVESKLDQLLKLVEGAPAP